MSASPLSPATLSGGFILFDAAGRTLQRSIAFQFNPDTLTRSLVPRASSEGGDRLEALRLAGPPVETIKLEAEFDGTHHSPPRNITADLAALETIISPTAASLEAEIRLAASGTLELLPAPAPLVLLALGPRRILPVRLTDIGLVEEMFDTSLQPIRARVSISVRVLTSDDLAPGSKGAALFLEALRARETAAGRAGVSLGRLGLTGV